MLVLHAGVFSRRLLLWGEAPPGAGRRSGRNRSHPFDSGPERLSDALAIAGLRPARSRLKPAVVHLPSISGQPVPSSPLIAEIPSSGKPRIAEWSVTSLAPAPAEALDFLCACAGNNMLEPGVLIGNDLTYWVAAMRFAGTLVARQQFLPDVIEEGDEWFARWRAACLGRNEDRRHLLAAAMPAAARGFEPETHAASLLDYFLDSIVDAIVRSSALAPPAGEGLHNAWLAALHSPDGRLDGREPELRELERHVHEWRRPIAATAAAPFRLCFRLEEPEGDPNEPWNVRYLLQARSDPSLLVPASTIWNGADAKALAAWKSGFKPREHLLVSLGQASGICPRIEDSLRSQTPSGYPVDATGAHDFLTTKAMTLEEAGFGVLLPAWWTRKGTKARLGASAHTRTAFHGAGLSLDSLLDFQWQISIGGEKITLAELKALAALKAPLVKFRGQWVEMRAHEIQSALDFWKKKGGRITAREVVRMALGAAKLPGEIQFEGVTAEGWIADLLRQLEGSAPFQEIPVPSNLDATLRPYQVRGYSWLSFLGRWGLGACLADDMGLGKTIQTLSLIQHNRDAGTNRPVLLVCPTSVVGNWQKEAARFTPLLPVMVHHGSRRKKDEAFAGEADQQALVISSYALLNRDFELLRKVSWAGVVLDEAQNIKNPETRQATAARALSGDYRIALTGTPVENNVGDLWSIMEFVNPGLLGARAEFKRDFFLPIQSARDPSASARLKKLTGPFILRRLKTDKSVIADLPDKMEMKVFCTLTREQASLYTAVVNESVAAIEEAEGIQRKGIVLATLTRLKQVCNHPAQFLGDNSALPGRSGKLARLTEMIEEAIAAGDRVLVFSQFAEMGEMLRRHLQETFGREVLFLHGGVPKKQRDTMVERFQEDPDGPRVFLLSLKAGGTGLNLTRANHVFHFDRWWNPAVENQATDRAFRIGQTKNVQVHKFVCAGTLEERIDEMIEQKKGIAVSVVGSGETWLTELSTGQLRQLFALRKDAVAE
jgi:SNF2 family DNA or RNA helicase